MQPETQRRSCFACRIPTEAKLARNHHPASNYSHPFANMLQLPILDLFSFFSKQPSESKKPLRTSTKEQQITRGAAGRSKAALTSPLAGGCKAGGWWKLGDDAEGWGTMLQAGGQRWRLGDDAAQLWEQHKAWPLLMSCPCQIFQQQNCSQVPAHAWRISWTAFPFFF